MPSIETRLALKRFVRHRDDGTVIFQKHDVGEGIASGWALCLGCGWEGCVDDARLEGVKGFMCPVQELEVEEMLAYEKAHAAAQGAKCVLCGKNWVDVMNGFDTCQECVSRGLSKPGVV